jgi:hypothetical protein
MEEQSQAISHQVLNNAFDSAVTNGASIGSNVRRLTRLSVSEAPFRSTGLATIKTTVDGTVNFLEIPIKSVDLEDVETLVMPYRPAVPTKRERIDGKWTTILDPANQDYIDRNSKYQRKLARTWVLMALDIDVVNNEGVVVWSADNSVVDLDAATQVLKKSGFVDNQFADMLNEVRALTAVTERNIEQD